MGGGAPGFFKNIFLKPVAFFKGGEMDGGRDGATVAMLILMGLEEEEEEEEGGEGAHTQVRRGWVS